MKTKNTKKLNFALLLTLIVSLLSHISYAQGTWDGSPTTTVTVDDAGVGTLNPEGKLEVNYCGTKDGLVVTKRDNCATGGTTGGGGGGVIGDGGTPPVSSFANDLEISFPRIANQGLLAWGRLGITDFSNPTTYKTRFSFLSSGSNGFNIENPRASLDVMLPRFAGNKNEVVAIFGTMYQPLNSPVQYSRHLQIIPDLGKGAYNGISEEGDMGLFFTDGLNDGLNGVAGLVIAPWNDNDATNTNELGIRILANGNVGIGTPLTSNPYYYKLAVNGVIGAKELVVEEFSAAWPDYVFKADYELMSLDSVKAYTEANFHLPEVPSEADIKENGLAIGEMQAVMLKKIEELTLYLIDIKEENDELRDRVKVLETSNSAE